jgi:hypothetical protein
VFLRAKIRNQDGKRYRYCSVVENRREGRQRTAQRTVLYLGESTIASKSRGQTLEVFDLMKPGSGTRIGACFRKTARSPPWPLTAFR